MKIGLYSTSELPTKPFLEGYGGVETTVGGLAKAYDELGHEVHLFAVGDSYEPKNGELHVYNGNDFPDSELNREQVMYNSFDKELFKNLDILHDHSHWHYPAELVPKLKYCFTLHALKPNVKHFDPKLDYNGITQCYDHARFEKWMTSMRFRTVLGGICIDAYEYQASKSDRLMWISRMFPPKGAEIAIEIAEMMEMPIDIVGGSHIDVPAYVNKIKRLCDNSEYANFVGLVTHAEKVKYYQNAKAVILPIRTFMQHVQPTGNQMEMWVEAACLVPMEANACGTPVVASPNGIIGEFISEGVNGFLAIEPEDFVDKINRLDELKPEMCRCIAEKFTMKNSAKGYLNLYQAILDGKTW